MRSLRSRLILAFSLVAIVPLAVAMALLSRRLQETVRAEADDRLAGVLATLQAQLQDEAGRMADQLATLGRDPALKRLLLVEPGEAAELSDALAEKRALLGMDFLQVADTSGRVIADAAAARPGPASSARPARAVGLASTSAVPGTTVDELPGGAGLALVGRGPILYRNQPVGLLQGGLVLDRDWLERLRRTTGVELTLRNRSGAVVATTLRSSPAPGRFLERRLSFEPRPGSGATLAGTVSTESADRTVTALRLTSLLLGLLGLGLAVLLGTLWSLQISRPVERLARFSERIARGEWDEPLAVRSFAEMGALIDALERMRAELRDYRDRLVVSERHAAWGAMARKVAHEVKNPLTPIAISVADLKRSFDLGRPDFPEILDQAVRTIAEEVESLKRILQEFSELGRLPAPEPAPCRVGELIGDLETLYGREIAEGRLRIDAPQRDRTITTDRGQLRQALVNLIQNALEALEGHGRIEVAARAGERGLELSVADDGPGLDPDQRARIFLPEFTTKAHGRGLGLTIVERIVHDLDGTVVVESEPGRGTTFRIHLPLAGEVP